jgi:hypothetical protein
MPFALTQELSISIPAALLPIHTPASQTRSLLDVLRRILHRHESTQKDHLQSTMSLEEFIEIDEEEILRRDYALVRA